MSALLQPWTVRSGIKQTPIQRNFVHSSFSSFVLNIKHRPPSCDSYRPFNAARVSHFLSDFLDTQQGNFVNGCLDNLLLGLFGEIETSSIEYRVSWLYRRFQAAKFAVYLVADSCWKIILFCYRDQWIQDRREPPARPHAPFQETSFRGTNYLSSTKQRKPIINFVRVIAAYLLTRYLCCTKECNFTLV